MLNPSVPAGRRPGLLVLGHGSRRAEANEAVVAVARQAAASLGWDLVQAAYLELAEPSIPTGFDLLVAAGAEHVVVHPYFLFPGTHTTKDVPDALLPAVLRHPDVGVTMTEPLYGDPRLVDVVLSRVGEALAAEGTGGVGT